MQILQFQATWEPPLTSESLTFALCRVIFTVLTDCCHFLLTCLGFVLLVFLNAGGPGVHDPCERDPTDVLSDLSPQQADSVTESAQVSHICCHLPIPSPADSAFLLCIRSSSDLTFCVSQHQNLLTCLCTFNVYVKRFIPFFSPLILLF